MFTSFSEFHQHVLAAGSGECKILPQLQCSTDVSLDKWMFLVYSHFIIWLYFETHIYLIIYVCKYESVYSFIHSLLLFAVSFL